jgi:hypothetical protein
MVKANSQHRLAHVCLKKKAVKLQFSSYETINTKQHKWCHGIYGIKVKLLHTQFSST